MYKPYQETSRKRVIMERRFHQFEAMDDSERRLEYFHFSVAPAQEIESITVEGPVLTFCRYIIKWKFGSGRFYKKTIFLFTLKINRETKRFWVNNNTGYLTTQFISTIKDFEFIANLPVKILNKTVLKGIFMGRVSSQEDAVKEYLKSCKCSEFPWRKALSHLRTSYTSLTLLKEVLVNPVDFISTGYETTTLNEDMIKQALALGKKIDHRWSEKRMREEHQEWTRILMLKDLSSKKSIPVWRPKIVKAFAEHGFEVLNDEKRTYEEGMTMHHCVYTNYWGVIEAKKYLALHSTVNGDDITIGINTHNPTCIHQVYKRYNKSLTLEEREDVIQRLSLLNPVLESIKYWDSVISTEEFPF